MPFFRCRGQVIDEEIHHIDPQNGELVSGLDVPANRMLESVSLNAQIGNMFLPYRGNGPSQPFDMAWFLDPDTEEWVEAEWLGRWWTSKAKRYDSRCKPRVKGRQFSDEHKAKLSANAKQRGNNGNHPPRGHKFSQESRDKMSKAKRGKPWSAARRQAYINRQNRK